jgi:hypothetical protein
VDVIVLNKFRVGRCADLRWPDFVSGTVREVSHRHDAEKTLPFVLLKFGEVHLFVHHLNDAIHLCLILRYKKELCRGS